MLPVSKKYNNQNWLPNFFNDFFDNDWMARTNATAPAINVLENEKSYDIDLSGVTHSWTRRGDSVDVTLPDYVNNLAVSCPWQSSGSNLCWFYTDSIPTHVVTMGYDNNWGRIYYFEAGLSGQSTNGTDSVFVSASIYWRPDSL